MKAFPKHTRFSKNHATSSISLASSTGLFSLVVLMAQSVMVMSQVAVKLEEIILDPLSLMSALRNGMII